MRRLAADESGLAGTVLVLAIAWALAAVFMLTRTLIAAQQIDRRVEEITTLVTPIDEDLDAIELAGRTNELADNILVAADPLAGQLGQVVEAGRSIDGSAGSILDSVRSINDTVADLNATVGVGGEDDSIHARFEEILAVAGSIDPGVAGINQRADRVIVLVRAIQSDTTDILSQVGPGHGSPVDATLHGHANSIDCSPLVVARSEHCDDHP